MKFRIIKVFLLCIGMATMAIAEAQVRNTAAKGHFETYYVDSNTLHLQFISNNTDDNIQLSDAVLSSYKKPVKQVKNDRLRMEGNTLQMNLPYGAFQVSYWDTVGLKGLRFQLKASEKLFGAGERALPLNRRGYKLALYNNPWYGYGEGADNLNYSVPFIMSSAGYGILFDNPSKGYLDLGKTRSDVLEYGTNSGALDCYIIFGNYQQVLQGYHRLTGNQPLPPRWAMGNLMSRFGYTSEAQVRSVLAKMQQASIPVDAVIYDLFWFGDSIKGTMGNLDWVNKKAWPAPEKMIRDFKAQGIQTILITEPYFVKGSKQYKASLPYQAVDSARKPYLLTKFYFGAGGLLDIFRKDARDWFWTFYKKQINKGGAGWWGDLGEPEHHPADLYHRIPGHKQLFRSDEVHNLYGHTWTKMLYQRYAKEYPDTRLFSLNRAGFAGSQRYGIFPWTGDVSRSWGGLRAQLPVLLGMAMSGIPYVHSDAGGFAGGEGDLELYVRWLQLAAFTPVFRPHGTALYEVEPAAPSFPSEAALVDTPYRQRAKAAIDLRYHLLPYNYTLAYRQAAQGKPLMAPLYYYHPSDTTATGIQDQYFWGEQLMVAPVLEKGITERKVYLPAGTWTDLYSDSSFGGGQWITQNTDPARIPVYVKEGSFLPLWLPVNKIIRNTGEYGRNEAITVRYFPSPKRSVYTLYEDDGKSRDALKKGHYGLIRFTGVTEKNKVTVTISASNPAWYAGSRKILLEVPGKLAYPLKGSINRMPLRSDQHVKTIYAYNTDQVFESVMIAFSGKPVTLVFYLPQ